MKSKGNKVHLVVAVLLTLLIFISTGVTYLETKSTMTQSIKEHLEQQMEDALDLLEGEIERRWEHLQYISELPDIVSMEWEKQYSILRKSADTFTFKDIFIVTPEGVGYYSDDEIVRDHSKEVFFEMKNEGERFITEPFLDKENQFSIITMALPIKKDGKIIGTIGGTIDLSMTNDIIQNLRIGSDGYGFVINKDGKFITNPDMSLVYEGISVLNPPEGYEELQVLAPLVEELKDRNSGTEFIRVNNTSYMAVYHAIQDTPWMLTFMISEQEALVEMRESLLKQMFAAFGAVTLVVIAAMFINKWVTFGVSKLEDYTMDMGEIEAFAFNEEHRYGRGKQQDNSIRASLEEVSQALDLIDRLSGQMESSIWAGNRDGFETNSYLEPDQVREVEKKLSVTVSRVQENIKRIDDMLDSLEE